MIKPTDFMGFLYASFAGFGIAGGIAAAIFSGGPGLAGYFLGLLIIGLVLYFWDRTLAKTLQKKKANWAWESLIIFLRYILIGGLFYAMISLFAVSWVWFAVGISTLLPSLVFYGGFFKRGPQPTGSF